LPRLVQAATAVFIAQGYQRAQMDDVAAALGVAKGTLYGYVESKAALFDLVIRCADGQEPLPGVSSLPWRAPPAESTAGALRTRMAASFADPELRAALERSEHPEPAVELTGILRALYRRMSQHRQSIQLVDRCSQDLPELAGPWLVHDGERLANLARYLDLRGQKRLLRPFPSSEVAARAVLETLSYWAVHRHWDAPLRPVLEEDVETTVLGLMLFGLADEDD
jgi:AcrR family transcriptional regulator